MSLLQWSLTSSILVLLCTCAQLNQQQQQTTASSAARSRTSPTGNPSFRPNMVKELQQPLISQHGQLGEAEGSPVVPSQHHSLPHSSQQLSRNTRSDRLQSLQTSLRMVLRAAALSAKKKKQRSRLSGKAASQQPVSDDPSPSLNHSSSSSSSSSAAAPNADFYFAQRNDGDDREDTVNETADADGETMPSEAAAAAAYTAAESMDGGPEAKGVLPEDQDSVTTLSLLLHEVFREHNPSTPPNYFMAETHHHHDDYNNNNNNDDNNNPLQPDLDTFSPPRDSNHPLFTPNLPPPLQHLSNPAAFSKRAPETIPAESPSSSSSSSSKVPQQQYAHNDTALSIQERSWRCSLPDVLLGDGDLPWTCHQRWAWRFLGEHVYPSRVYEAVCEGRSCWYGHFNCTPVTYTLHVLELCLQGCHDQRVPFPLRSFWQWTDLNVTVGCQCVR